LIDSLVVLFLAQQELLENLLPGLRIISHCLHFWGHNSVALWRVDELGHCYLGMGLGVELATELTVFSIESMSAIQVEVLGRWRPRWRLQSVHIVRLLLFQEFTHCFHCISLGCPTYGRPALLDSLAQVVELWSHQ